jgi:sugar phosphate isomerase/epimerase
MPSHDICTFMKMHISRLLIVLLSCFLISGVGLARSGGEHQAGIGPSFKGPIGLQLYSLREQFAKDVPGTLDQVRDFGFKYVELAGTYKVPPDKFRQMLDARGLKAVSAHIDYELLRDHIDDVVRDAKMLGLEYVGCAWIPHKDPFDEKTCREAIDVFNHAGQVLARNGMKFFYHVHGYEFQPHGEGTLLDLLFHETNPKYVNYQMDVFWIVFPGRDPVKLLKQYGNRFILMHLKDMRKGIQTGSLIPETDVRNDVVLGTGQMDWPAILKAARADGIKFYFIEDESPTSVQQIPQTLHYLETVKF